MINIYKLQLKRKTRQKVFRTFSVLILSLGAAAMLLPFAWMLSTSLKDISDVFTFPPSFFGKTIAWDNYLKVSDRLSFPLLLGNTIIVTLLVLIGQIFTSTTAGFAFAYLKFRGREILFQIILLAIMIPYHVLLVPTFVLLRDMHLLDNLLALVLPVLVSPFGIFLMRQAFRGIPRSLAEAAKIDGCNPLGIYSKIFMPLVIPAITTLGIFIFVGNWNDFLRPLIFLSSNKHMTLTLGIYAMQGTYSTDWGTLMATVTLSLLPVIVMFLLVQDLFVKGVALSGLKA